MRHVDRVIAVGQAFGFLEPPKSRQIRLAVQDFLLHIRIAFKCLARPFRHW